MITSLFFNKSKKLGFYIFQLKSYFLKSYQKKDKYQILMNKMDNCIYLLYDKIMLALFDGKFNVSFASNIFLRELIKDVCHCV